jgi:hypothetical protein
MNEDFSLAQLILERERRRAANRRLRVWMEAHVGSCLRGALSLDTFLVRFAAHHPRRCVVCALHAWGHRHEFEREEKPAPHRCPEERPDGKS